MDKKPAEAENLEAEDELNGSTDVVEDPANDIISAESSNPKLVGPPPKDSFFKRLISRLLGFNLYLLLFIFIVVIVIVISLFGYSYNRNKSGVATINTTSLSQDTLNQLANSDASVGTSDQVLNVQSSAVFAGKVLARSDLQVAGNLELGGDLNLPNINVSDVSTLGQVTVSKNLAVSGNSAVQGQQTIGQSLQVGGGGSFGSNLTAPQVITNNLQLNGDLVITHHITAGGGTPGRTSGSALGSGGTASVSGSDTSGSVTINTGGGPAAGCFTTINFTAKYNATPHIMITPVGNAAAQVAYYVNRTASGFSVCAASAPPAGQSFGYDYLVVG